MRERSRRHRRRTNNECAYLLQLQVHLRNVQFPVPAAYCYPPAAPARQPSCITHNTDHTVAWRKHSQVMTLSARTVAASRPSGNHRNSQLGLLAAARLQLHPLPQVAARQLQASNSTHNGRATQASGAHAPGGLAAPVCSIDSLERFFKLVLQEK